MRRSLFVAAAAALFELWAGTASAQVDYFRGSAIPQIKRAVATVTSAQLLNSFTTPVQLLPAPAAGTFRWVEYMTVQRAAGTAYTLNASTAFKLYWGSDTGTLWQMSHADSVTLAATGPVRAVLLPPYVSAQTSLWTTARFGGLAINFISTVANPTVGTGDLTFTIYYRDFTP